jgi:putative transposase
MEQIRRINQDSRGVYGAPRVHAELRLEHNVRVGRKRVARLMRSAGIAGVKPRKRFRTTIRIPGVTPATDLVKRDFRPAAPNVLWVADITYLRTGEGWLYLAAVQDVYSRQIVGWSMTSHMRSSLVVDALEMAVGLRQPTAGGLIAHTDRGSQYTSLHYTDRLDEHGIAPSVGSRGDAYDNAMAEAWVATYKTELVAFARRLLSFERLEHETLQWISFYNNDRLHEELDDLPPVEYEQLTQASPKRPCGPPEADRPALPEGAPASLGHYEETTKPSLR